MEDELEDKVLYQTYVSNMKLMSKFAVGLSSLNSPVAYVWKLFRYYLLRPEVVFCGIVIFIFLLYLQAVDIWTRGLLGRIQATLGYSRSRASKLKLLDSSAGDHQSWEVTKEQSSAYAVLGRRPRMEDRFVIDENINSNTGISFFAIFDGHGGEFAADFAKDILVDNLYKKIIESTNIVKGNSPSASTYEGGSPYVNRKNQPEETKLENKENESNTALARRRESFKKSYSTAEDCAASKNATKETDVFTSKLNALIRPLAKDNMLNVNNNNGGNVKAPQIFDAKCYIENGKINFGKMITDEVLSADFKLVETAKKTTNVAGTTALIAIIHGTKLIVANVGDSRGVMCDAKGNAIPLSFDHKPQQVRERKRIHDAGGFIAFRGVWRVAGILATSRALGDYPLKDKNLVIADPDILTFELLDHKPIFIILASDGLWDTFTNEEAVTFVKDHINETGFGAKNLALEAYHRGSVDNITVIIITFKNGIYRISSSTSNSDNLTK
uniref:Putative serine/threonine protein phosphatase n=1 Tax=Tabanus bromius TaxID=304241 RepID=A0A0K8TR79_TABBR